ncbi:hypothetical protein ONZ45_g19332 [Pleurotus djamor]|nr:hypothetical protein ONZ45_g19332 [Pleurotus djamor]
MDPIGLTTSILEIGFQIKDSIDTFARRRSHAKALASDVVADLQRIAEFYEKHTSILSHEALGPLRDSLDALKSDLYRVHKRCQVFELTKDDSQLKRLVSNVKLWMDSEDIDADLVRIEKRIQTSMKYIMLLSGARVEVRVTKIESILANAYQSRGHIQQFDSVFTQELLHGDSGLRAFDHSLSELDHVDLQYVHLKAMKLIGAISVATLKICGAKLSANLIYARTITKPAMYNIIFRTAQLQALVSRENIPITDLCRKTLPLVRMLNHLGAMGIIQKLLGTVEIRLRQTLRLGIHRLRLPPHIKEEEEDAFDALERILYSQQMYGLGYGCGKSSTADSICHWDIKRAPEYIWFSRSRLERRAAPSIHHCMRFLRSLMPSIYYHTIRGQVEECITYCLEALEVIQPCTHMTSTSRENPNIVVAAGALQSQILVLDHLSLMQALDCDYTSAYHTGLNCITSIKVLSNIDKSMFPDDLDCFPGVSEYYQRKMPTWTSVVRNPEHRISYIEDSVDNDDAGDGSPGPRQIEWGIAL